MSCCSDSNSVTVFADNNRDDGTEEVVFDTKQSEKIYYFVDYTLVIPPTTVVATQEQGNSVGGLGAIVDKNTDTSLSYNVDRVGPSEILRFNFGSQAVRDIVAVLEGIATASGARMRVSARWAGSDLVFSAFSTLFEIGDGFGSGTTFPKTRLRMPFGAQNLQYIEIEWDGTVPPATGTPSAITYEVFDPAEGLGTSNVNIQVKNEITNNWFTVDTLSEIDSVEDTELLTTKTEIQPNNSLTRIQLVNDGKWNGSVTAILVNPKFV